MKYGKDTFRCAGDRKVSTAHQRIVLGRTMANIAEDQLAADVLRFGKNANDLLCLGVFLELDGAIDFCKQRIVSANSNVSTGLEASTTLAYENASCRHQLASEALDAKPLCIAVAAVS